MYIHAALKVGRTNNSFFTIRRAVGGFSREARPINWIFFRISDGTMAEKKSYKIKNIDYTTKEKHRRPEKSQWEENFQKAKRRRESKKTHQRKVMKKISESSLGVFELKTTRKAWKRRNKKIGIKILFQFPSGVYKVVVKIETFPPHVASHTVYYIFSVLLIPMSPRAGWSNFFCWCKNSLKVVKSTSK